MKILVLGIATVSIVVVAALAFGQMGGMHGRGMMRSGGMMGGQSMMGSSRTRHRYVMRNGIDDEYASKTNPLPSTDRIIRAGQQTYATYCASCHGASGRGDGAAGTNLNPPPSNIAAFSKTGMATDPYLYWTIAEGGAPVGTAMPPFKDALDEKQIWELILYLRQM